MKPVTHEAIVEWVEKTNKKFGRSTDGWSVYWVETLIARGAKPELYDDWYLIWILTPDAWGDKQLAVLTCGCDNAAAFRKMQERIIQIARENDCRYIEQGSEIDDKYNQWLVRQGYKAHIFRKEV